MNYHQDPAISAMLRGSARGSVPRRGVNPDFDRYCDSLMDDLDAEDTDFTEMRRAAWATWDVGPPSQRETVPASNEDEELARVLAMSAQEHNERYSRDNSVQGEGDDDEELRRAIAMSEEESRAPKRQRREETPEEERRMLAEAMAMSMQHDAINPIPVESEDESGSPKSSTGPTPPPPPPAVLPAVLSGRAQMEAERIARQKAREAATGTTKVTNSAPSRPPTQSSSRITTISDINPRNDALPAAASTSRINGSQRPSAHHPLQSAGPFPTDAAGEYYLDGELRHVALTIGQPSRVPTFTPHQVVGTKSEIALLVMCSFCIDDEWLNAILPPPNLVPTVLIRPHPKEKHNEWNGKVQVQPNGEVWSYPRMVGSWGSAHMKFFWIFYKTGRVRVVISTANMVHYDWEWIENTVFIQDFLPQSSAPKRSPMGDDFRDRFRELLEHVKVHKAVRHQVESHPFGKGIPLDPSEALQDLTKWDFSRVRVKLVMSVPGKYTGFEEMNEYGLCRLGALLKEASWMPPTGERVEGEYQGSSLGNYTLEWIDTFHRFIGGREARDLVGRPKAKEWPPIKVLFPSLDTVNKSELGKEGGGTMFVGQSWKAVTRRLFHDANSKRGGALMHSKVLVALFAKQPDHLGVEANGKKRKVDDPDGLDIGGWAYVGSHNFTPSAWGNVRLNDKPPTLSISNYELGIVFPLPRDHAAEAADAVAPYKRPARPYGPDDVPWDQKLKGEGRLTMHTPK